MSPHRFYLPPEQCQGPELLLSGGEAHHALHVLRLQRGQSVTVLDGAGKQFRCEISEAGKRDARLRVLETKIAPPLPCQLTLLQAVPRGKIIESIIQKATELGVARVVPLLSERVVTQLAPAEAERKAQKWQEVAIEAVKQCGAFWLPRIEAPVTPAELLARRQTPELGLVGSLQEDARHPRIFFEEFQAAHRRKPGSIAVWVGPEGDFSLPELAAIQGTGAKPITLGSLVLRVETAAVYCLAVVNYELAAPPVGGAGRPR